MAESTLNKLMDEVGLELISIEYYQSENKITKDDFLSALSILEKVCELNKDHLVLRECLSSNKKEFLRSLVSNF